MKAFLLGAVVLLGLAVSSRAEAPADANDDSSTAKMKADLRHATEVVNGAKKPEDLDALLSDLQKYQENNFNPGSYTAEDRALYQQLSSALEFTKTWQGYLAHVNWGQGDQARGDLTNLLQNSTGAGLIPRSKILALAAGAVKPAAVASTPVAEPVAPEVDEVTRIADGITTLDGLEPALKQLYALAPSNPAADNFAKSVAPIVEVYGDLKAGLPTSVNLTFMGDTTGPGVSVKVNSLLLNFIFQHYFDTYAGAPPAEGEMPAAYAARVKAAAMAAQDWPLLRKALVAHEYLVRNVAGAGGSNDADNETAGLNRMIDGLNQETAGQYALAVASYQNALKSGSLDVPAKFIGGHLDGIKRDHPQDYDSGMSAFLSPPLPNYYPGMNPMFYNNPAMFGRSPSLPGTGAALPPERPSPVITIPGAKTAAAAPSAASTAPPAPSAPAQHP